jgi:transposase InsO family protein
MGLSIQDACSAAGFSRSYYYQLKKGSNSRSSDKNHNNNKRILKKIKKIKTKHPFWGYRRTWAWLKYRLKETVNKKRVLGLMRKNGLTVDRKTCKAKRTPQRSKPRADRKNSLWGIDMTKFIINGLGWCYLVVVLDWYTKKIVGYDVALRSKSGEWQNALNMAVDNQFPEGVRDAELKLVSDNGSQPTSTSFMKQTAHLGIKQIFTSYNNPKGNADTERVMRTIKEELIWLNEFETYQEAKEAIKNWVEKDYNFEYVHSALGYKSPLEFEAVCDLQELQPAA